jgi:hypothetical protein
MSMRDPITAREAALRTAAIACLGAIAIVQVVARPYALARGAQIGTISVAVTAGALAPVAALAARNRRAIAALARCGRPTGAALRRVWRDVRAELLVATTLVLVASVLVAQVPGRA